MACSQSVNNEKQTDDWLQIFEQTLKWPNHKECKHHAIAETHVGIDISSDALIDEQGQRDQEKDQKAKAKQGSYDPDIGKEEILTEIGNETVLPHQ